MAIVFDEGLLYVRTVPNKAVEETSTASANQLGGNVNSNFAEIAGCNAGPNVRAGFTLPPVMGPKARMQTVTVMPIANGASRPAVPRRTALRTVLARKKVPIASRRKPPISVVRCRSMKVAPRSHGANRPGLSAGQSLGDGPKFRRPTKKTGTAFRAQADVTLAAGWTTVALP